MKTIDPSLTGSDKSTFAQRMREARINSKLTQEVAANRIGLSKGQLGRIERGGVVMVSDASSLTRAASAYGVSPLWLYAGASAGLKHVPDWFGAPKLDLVA